MFRARAVCVSHVLLGQRARQARASGPSALLTLRPQQRVARGAHPCALLLPGAPPAVAGWSRPLCCGRKPVSLSIWPAAPNPLVGGVGRGPSPSSPGMAGVGACSLFRPRGRPRPLPGDGHVPAHLFLRSRSGPLGRPASLRAQCRRGCRLAGGTLLHPGAVLPLFRAHSAHRNRTTTALSPCCGQIVNNSLLLGDNFAVLTGFPHIHTQYGYYY